MNAFPMLAGLNLCVSLAALRATFTGLRETPRVLDTTTKTRSLRAAIDEANEGLLDRELASDDPIGAWLDRYLTPTAD